MALVEMEGLRKKISIELTPEVQIGDYVIVHVGFSLEVLDTKLAQETLDLINELS